MTPDDFLRLDEGDKVALRNGDGTPYTVVEKIGLAYLAVHVAFIKKDETKEWVFLNERQVERLEHMTVGVQISRRHPSPEHHIITQVNKDHAIAVRTPILHLREADAWVQVKGPNPRSATLLDAIGPAHELSVGKVSL